MTSLRLLPIALVLTLGTLGCGDGDVSSTRPTAGDRAQSLTYEPHDESIDATAWARELARDFDVRVVFVPSASPDVRSITLAASVAEAGRRTETVVIGNDRPILAVVSGDHGIDPSCGLRRQTVPVRGNGGCFGVVDGRSVLVWEEATWVVRASWIEAPGELTDTHLASFVAWLDEWSAVP